MNTQNTTPPYPYTSLHKRKGGFDSSFANLPEGVKVEVSGEYAIIYAQSSDALTETESIAFFNTRGARGWGVA